MDPSTLVLLHIQTKSGALENERVEHIMRYAYARHPYSNCRPVVVQQFEQNKVALFELALEKGRLQIINEMHDYRSQRSQIGLNGVCLAHRLTPPVGLFGSIAAKLNRLTCSTTAVHPTAAVSDCMHQDKKSASVAVSTAAGFHQKLGSKPKTKFSVLPQLLHTNETKSRSLVTNF